MTPPFPKRPILAFKVLAATSLMRLCVLWMSPKRLFHVAKALQTLLLSGSEEPVRSLAYTRYILKMSPVTPKNRCLIESVVLYSLLSKRFVGMQLKLGLREGPKPGQLEGHAWLEQNGQALFQDKSVADFQQIYSFPPTKGEK